jgi:predicted GNAT family acetyltransferase
MIIKEIKSFYTSKNLTPRIYSDFISGQLDKIKDYLTENGFTIINENDQIFMIHTSECKINIPYTLKIRCVKKGEDISFIHEITNKYPSWRVYDNIEKKLNSSDYNLNLFVGYSDDNAPVAMATVEYFDGLAFIDEVETAEKYQGRGYARQLTKFLIDYHYEHHADDMLYLYYFNPVAGRIYKEAGFTDFNWDFELWSAYIDL